jgi:hypothetical protein
MAAEPAKQFLGTVSHEYDGHWQAQGQRSEAVVGIGQGGKQVFHGELLFN